MKRLVGVFLFCLLLVGCGRVTETETTTEPETYNPVEITEDSGIVYIPAGKVYLSPMIDCYDGLPVAWTIGTSPSADLANSMLDAAISTLNPKEHPIVHSDRGGHYRWPGWIERMEKANLVRSMSRKGCSPDNAACEGFHGRVKTNSFTVKIGAM